MGRTRWGASRLFSPAVVLRAALAADELEEAMARGAALDLDEVIAEILVSDEERGMP